MGTEAVHLDRHKHHRRPNNSEKVAVSLEAGVQEGISAD